MKSARTNGKALKAILKAQGIQVDFPMTLKFEGDEINITQGEFAKIEIKPYKKGKTKRHSMSESTEDVTVEEYELTPDNIKSWVPKKPI